jgi:hypothetical protein
MNMNTPIGNKIMSCPVVAGQLGGGHSGGGGGYKRTSSGVIVKKPPVDSTGWCYTRCKEDTNYSFAWTIEGFRRKMEQFSNGQCLTSHVFK